MEKIQVNGEFLFELSSNKDWGNKFPKILPPKTRGVEQWVWVDVNGNVFNLGKDFRVAKKQGTYPCKVYRLQSVSAAKYPITENQQPITENQL
jgi:hypothetical protein